MTATHDLGAGDYISLTTFRKDGRAVSTPVWVVGEPEALLVITDAESGKVKRLRNSGRVQVAACDMRGRVSGPTFAGTASLLDSAGTDAVSRAVTAKYGWQARAFGLIATARGVADRLLRRPGSPERVGIRIIVDSDEPVERATDQSTD